jgi:hypothetical protein
METPLCEIPNGLAELIDERIRNLLDRLQGAFSVKEVQAELRELDLLLGSFKRNDEQLEKLLTDKDARHERSAMIAEMRNHRRAIVENREVLERLHAKSHNLMLESARLIADCKSRVDKLVRTHGDYAAEMCAHCKGLGGTSEAPCPACMGEGTVLVHQPPLKCPRCNGEGKGSHHAIALFQSDLCLVCHGSGWVIVRNRNQSGGVKRDQLS